MESVRTAGPGDWARCAELVEEARSHQELQRGGPEQSQFGAGGGRPVPGPGTVGPADVEGWTADRTDRTVLLGLYHDVPVGIGAGQVLGPSWGGRRLGRVECVYVEPAARQVGVGASILAGLMAWFATHGCTDAEAPALPGDRSTKQLLEAAGFKARLLLLHHPIG